MSVRDGCDFPKQGLLATPQTHLRRSFCRRAKHHDGIVSALGVGYDEVGVARRIAGVRRKPEDLGGVPAEGRAREALPGGVNNRFPVGGGSAVALGRAPVVALDPDLVERQTVGDIHGVGEHVVGKDGSDHGRVPDVVATAARPQDDESSRRALHGDRVGFVGDRGYVLALVVDVAQSSWLVCRPALRGSAAHAAAVALSTEIHGVRASAGAAILWLHVEVPASFAHLWVCIGAVLFADVAEIAGLRRAVAVGAALIEGCIGTLEDVCVRALLPPQVGVALEAPRAFVALPVHFESNCPTSLR